MPVRTECHEGMRVGISDGLVNARGTAARDGLDANIAAVAPLLKREEQTKEKF